MAEVVYMIVWSCEAARRAGLTDDDRLVLSTQSEYDAAVVRAFRDNLPQPRQRAMAPSAAPKLVHAGSVIARITSRHPQLFGITAG